MDNQNLVGKETVVTWLAMLTMVHIAMHSVLSSPDVLSDVLTRRYNLLEDWVNGNKLVINPDKTHLLVMGPKSISARRNQVRIQAGQFIIVPTETEKLLGGHLHQSLQWNQHIRDNKHSITKQLTTRINGLKKRHLQYKAYDS